MMFKVKNILALQALRQIILPFSLFFPGFQLGPVHSISINIWHPTSSTPTKVLEWFLLLSLMAKAWIINSFLTCVCVVKKFHSTYTRDKKSQKRK